MSGYPHIDFIECYVYFKYNVGAFCRTQLTTFSSGRVISLSLCEDTIKYIFSPASPLLPLQVAIIAGNFDLAEIIKIHKVSDVGELRAAKLPFHFWFRSEGMHAVDCMAA